MRFCWPTFCLQHLCDVQNSKSTSEASEVQFLVAASKNYVFLEGKQFQSWNLVKKLLWSVNSWDSYQLRSRSWISSSPVLVFYSQLFRSCWKTRGTFLFWFALMFISVFGAFELISYFLMALGRKCPVSFANMIDLYHRINPVQVSSQSVKNCSRTDHSTRFHFFDIVFSGSGNLAIWDGDPLFFCRGQPMNFLVWWLVEKVNIYQNDHCGAIGDARFSDFRCLHLQIWCFVGMLWFLSLPTTHATCKNSCSESNQGRESSMDLSAIIWERRRQVPSWFLQVMWPLAETLECDQEAKKLAICQIFKHVIWVKFKLN